jgi:hypothetical protein
VQAALLRRAEAWSHEYRWSDRAAEETDAEYAIPPAAATSESAQITVEAMTASSAVHDVVWQVSRPGVLSDHLSSTAIPLLVRIPNVESMAGSEAEAGGVDWAALGRRAAVAATAVPKAGSATGLSASCRHLGESLFQGTAGSRSPGLSRTSCPASAGRHDGHDNRIARRRAIDGVRADALPCGGM